MPDRTSPAGAAAPHVDDLERISPDAWAWLLRPLRDALHAVDLEQVPEAGRLRSTPAVRLAGGRVRREVEQLLARGGPLWSELHRRLVGADDLPEELGWLVAGVRPVVVQEVPAAPHQERDREREDRLRQRAQRLQEERDEARRQLDGARVRAERAEEDRDELQRQLGRMTAEIEELRHRLEDAAEQRDQAVERERRRGVAELERLRGELADMRRVEQERRAEERRRDATAGAAPTSTATSRSVRRTQGTGAVRPGRPSQLPPRVRPGTREAVEALLHRGRLVLVDGYNLTLSQRSDLPLEQQRAWLVRALATQVARRGIRPTVVFDSDVAGPGGRRETGRGVTVRFTGQGTSADDELVFAVEALEEDEPVLVVTDDRELRDRLRPYRIDLVGTGPFRWILD